ncbi:MAG: metalloregulator ArsR/SmtB family transcription factor [Anaerolineaceae bacterium]
MSLENKTSPSVLRSSVTEAEILLLHQKVCYALGDPTRILLLYILREGPHSVGELTDRMKLPQSTVSRHLRVLRDRSLVRVEKRGTSNLYTLADTRITDALDLLRQVLNQQLSERAKLTAAIQCSYPPNEDFSNEE